jgi:hypothetical protein
LGVERKACSGDLGASSTARVVFLVLLILLAILTIVILAWIGPVVGGDSVDAILAV